MTVKQMRSQILKNPLPYLAIFTAHAIWAVNTVVSKLVLEQMPVMSLQFSRFLLASLLLSPLVITHIKKHGIAKADLLKFFLIGLFMIVLNNSFGYTGLIFTTAIDTSILGLFIPITSVIIGWWFFKEKIFKINLIGILVGLTGAIIIIGVPTFFAENLDSNKLIGDFLIIISGICFVIGFMMSGKMVKKYSALIVGAFSFIIGAVCFFPFAVLEYVSDPTWILELSFGNVLGFLFIALFATALAYFLIVWSLERANATQANLFNYIQPAITAAVAVPVLGESISPTFLIGAALVILGVYWGTIGKPHHHHFVHKAHRL